VDFPTFQRAIAKMGVVVDDSDLEEFFRVYDSNGNGRLDYKEFSDVIFSKAIAQGGYQSARPSTGFRGLKE